MAASNTLNESLLTDTLPLISSTPPTALGAFVSRAKAAIVRVIDAVVVAGYACMWGLTFVFVCTMLWQAFVADATHWEERIFPFIFSMAFCIVPVSCVCCIKGMEEWEVRQGLRFQSLDDVEGQEILLEIIEGGTGTIFTSFLLGDMAALEDAFPSQSTHSQSAAFHRKQGIIKHARYE